MSDRLFEHYRVNDLSLYVLVNKNVVGDPLSLVNEIAERVRMAYM